MVTPLQLEANESAFVQLTSQEFQSLNISIQMDTIWWPVFFLKHIKQINLYGYSSMIDLLTDAYIFLFLRPWQMGKPTLHNLTLSFLEDGQADATDVLSTRFGMRETSKTIDERGNSLFMVNRKKILIRGGGYAPDLLQRMSEHRHRQELEYVRHLGLNAIRLEGKFQSDSLFHVSFIVC